jgi:hypothetical protein
MLALFAIVLIAGVLPLAWGIIRLAPGDGVSVARPAPGTVALGTLAFNLTFLWQEVWLCIPKVLTPGLSPTLYHNNHEWTGDAPIAELLQGTGAVATLVSGLTFAVLLARWRRAAPTWQVFLFWMALQGLFQSLSQTAIGSVVRGNDVGRAFQYLALDGAARAGVLAATLAAMALAGRLLARLLPGSLVPYRAQGTRTGAGTFVMAGGLIVLCSVPFRVPRDPVEVLIVPTIVNLMGTAWLLVAMKRRGRPDAGLIEDAPGVAVPLVALALVLLLFQTVLRHGVPM